MPAEVIELLSSSEAGSPPKAATSARQQTSRQPQTAIWAENTNWQWPDSDASAVRPARNQEPDASVSNNDVWLLSDDDFGYQGRGDSKGDTCVNEPERKRRRIDQESQARSSKSGFVAGPSQPLRPTSPGRLNPTDRVPRHASRSPLHAGRTKPQFDFSSEPFTRSSPKANENEQSEPKPNRSRPLIDDIDDPFASPPPDKGEERKSINAERVVIDDIDPFASSSPAPIKRPPRLPQRPAPWDPISSSAPLPPSSNSGTTIPAPQPRRTQSEVFTLDDSDDQDSAQSDSDDDFPDIDGLVGSDQGLKLPVLSKPPLKPKAAVRRSTPTEPKLSAEEKVRRRQEKAAARVAEKERKAEEKKREREEKAREKQRAAALAQVNMIRTDKKKSTPEMIVDLPSTLDETVRLQAETILKDLEVESTSWTSPLDNVVKWRRKVNSQYNEQLGHWEPVEKRIDRENYAMVILTASQFVDLALGSGAADLETHALRMRRNFPNDTIIYLIEGLDLWLRKNRNIRNRQFVSAVRSGLEPPPPPPATDPPTSSQQQARRRKPTSEKPHAYIDQETIETALLRLQVLHSPSVLIHHTTVPLETARWIAVFTQHISTVPYRRQREASNNTNFCIETGQVRTGDSPRDTYLCMLQEVGRVTAPIAYGIAAEYPTVSRLVKGLERDGPLALEKVRRCVDKDGGVGDRAVGPAVSKRLWKIFTGRDEASTDV